MTDATEIPDLSELGPATRLAIRLGIQACDVAIRLLEEKQGFRTLGAEERRELDEWRNARHVILTQPYSKPYETRAASRVEAEPVL